MFDEAIAENRNWGSLTRNEIETSVSLAQIYAVAGQKDDAAKLVEVVKADPSLIDQAYRGLALVHAALGENDAAFEWLEKGYERREESVLSLKVDPKIDPLRSDPRFSALLKRIGVE
jgi:Tfp pilus assembly protein PilF